MDDYASKPVTNESLRTVLERWLPLEVDPSATELGRAHALLPTAVRGLRPSSGRLLSFPPDLLSYGRSRSGRMAPSCSVR